MPNEVSSDILNSYTVCTIIRSKKLSELRESIDSLFKSAHLILFLRSKHVKVVINGQTLLCIEKNTDNDITTISRNGEVISQWLTHTTSPFDVPSSIHEQMEEDKEEQIKKFDETAYTHSWNGKKQRLIAKLHYGHSSDPGMEYRAEITTSKDKIFEIISLSR